MWRNVVNEVAWDDARADRRVRFIIWNRSSEKLFARVRAHIVRDLGNRHSSSCRNEVSDGVVVTSCGWHMSTRTKHGGRCGGGTSSCEGGGRRELTGGRGASTCTDQNKP